MCPSILINIVLLKPDPSERNVNTTTVTFATNQAGSMLTSSFGHCFSINYQTLTYSSYSTVKEFDEYLPGYLCILYNSGSLCAGNHIGLCCNLACVIWAAVSGCTQVVCHRCMRSWTLKISVCKSKWERGKEINLLFTGWLYTRRDEPLFVFCPDLLLTGYYFGLQGSG